MHCAGRGVGGVDRLRLVALAAVPEGGGVEAHGGKRVAAQAAGGFAADAGPGRARQTVHGPLHGGDGGGGFLGIGLVGGLESGELSQGGGEPPGADFRGVPVAGGEGRGQGEFQDVGEVRGGGVLVRCLDIHGGGPLGSEAGAD